MGKGGFGSVVLGVWKGRRVAVKVLPLENMPRAGREDRVRRRTDSVESELNAR